MLSHGLMAGICLGKEQWLGFCGFYVLPFPFQVSILPCVADTASRQISSHIHWIETLAPQAGLSSSSAALLSGLCQICHSSILPDLLLGFCFSFLPSRSQLARSTHRLTGDRALLLRTGSASSLGHCFIARSLLLHALSLSFAQSPGCFFSRALLLDGLTQPSCSQPLTRSVTDSPGSTSCSQPLTHSGRFRYKEVFQVSWIFLYLPKILISIYIFHFEQVCSMWKKEVWHIHTAFRLHLWTPGSGWRLYHLSDIIKYMKLLTLSHIRTLV